MSINKKPKGGAKIGEGSSGCVVFPHIKCNSFKKLTKKNNYVSKIINLLNNDGQLFLFYV